MITLILGLLLGFGVTCAISWLLMTLYGMIAAACALPVFSFWFWFGVTILFGWLASLLNPKD